MDNEGLAGVPPPLLKDPGDDYFPGYAKAVSSVTFQMNASSLPHAKLMHAIEVIGTRVAPALSEGLADD